MSAAKQGCLEPAEVDWDSKWKGSHCQLWQEIRWGHYLLSFWGKQVSLGVQLFCQSFNLSYTALIVGDDAFSGFDNQDWSEGLF